MVILPSVLNLPLWDHMSITTAIGGIISLEAALLLVCHMAHGPLHLYAKEVSVCVHYRN